MLSVNSTIEINGVGDVAVAIAQWEQSLSNTYHSQYTHLSLEVLCTNLHKSQITMHNKPTHRM